MRLEVKKLCRQMVREDKANDKLDNYLGYLTPIAAEKELVDELHDYVLDRISGEPTEDQVSRIVFPIIHKFAHRFIKKYWVKED